MQLFATLLKSKRPWSTLEKEYLAVFWVSEPFQECVEALHAAVFPDHNNLRGLMPRPKSYGWPTSATFTNLMNIKKSTCSGCTSGSSTLTRCHRTHGSLITAYTSVDYKWRTWSRAFCSLDENSHQSPDECCTRVLTLSVILSIMWDSLLWHMHDHPAGQWALNKNAMNSGLKWVHSFWWEKWLGLFSRGRRETLDHPCRRPEGSCHRNRWFPFTCSELYSTDPIIHGTPSECRVHTNKMNVDPENILLILILWDTTFLCFYCLLAIIIKSTRNIGFQYMWNNYM